MKYKIHFRKVVESIIEVDAESKQEAEDLGAVMEAKEIEEKEERYPE